MWISWVKKFSQLTLQKKKENTPTTLIWQDQKKLIYEIYAKKNLHSSEKLKINDLIFQLELAFTVHKDETLTPNQLSISVLTNFGLVAFLKSQF